MFCNDYAVSQTFWLWTTDRTLPIRPQGGLAYSLPGRLDQSMEKASVAMANVGCQCLLEASLQGSTEERCHLQRWTGSVQFP